MKVSARPTRYKSILMRSRLSRGGLCGLARPKYRAGCLAESEFKKMVDAFGPLGEAPLVIIDQPCLTLDKLRASVRTHQRRGHVGLVVVDYLQLIAGRKGAERRQVEVSELSRGLKLLARDMRVPVLALSQLSRTLEMSADMRPALADLRGSGGLENEADAVLFVYLDDVTTLSPQYQVSLR